MMHFISPDDKPEPPVPFYLWLIMLASFILVVVFLWEVWVGYMRSI